MGTTCLNYERSPTNSHRSSPSLSSLLPNIQCQEIRMSCLPRVYHCSKVLASAVTLRIHGHHRIWEWLVLALMLLASPSPLPSLGQLSGGRWVGGLDGLYSRALCMIARSLAQLEFGAIGYTNAELLRCPVLNFLSRRFAVLADCWCVWVSLSEAKPANRSTLLRYTGNYLLLFHSYLDVLCMLLLLFIFLCDFSVWTAAKCSHILRNHCSQTSQIHEDFIESLKGDKTIVIVSDCHCVPMKSLSLSHTHFLHMVFQVLVDVQLECCPNELAVSCKDLAHRKTLQWWSIDHPISVNEVVLNVVWMALWWYSATFCSATFCSVATFCSASQSSSRRNYWHSHHQCHGNLDMTRINFSQCQKLYLSHPKPKRKSVQ